MNKKEMIERVLDEYIGWGCYELSITDLADQAIVIECEVEHSKFHTIVKNEIGNLPNRLVISEHHGIPGKALAIIVPLEEK